MGFLLLIFFSCLRHHQGHSCELGPQACLERSFSALPNSSENGALVWTCGDSCEGIGDRVRGIVSLFYIALKRKFAISSPDVAEIFSPNAYRWNETQTPCTATLVELDYGNSTHLLQNFASPTAFANQTVCVRTTQSFNTIFIQKFPLTFGNVSATDRTAYFGAAFRFLFRPRTTTISTYNSILHSAGLPPVKEFGVQDAWNAVHYRVGLGWDGVRDSVENTTTFASTFERIAVERRWTARIYVASDNAVAKAKLVHLIHNATSAQIDISTRQSGCVGSWSLARLE